MLIPIVAGAILGLAFDLKTYKLEQTYIYDHDEILKNTQVIHKAYTQSQYRLIQSSSESTDSLGIHGELAIKLKKGSIDIAGVGGIMTDRNSIHQAMKIFLIVTHETLTETYPSYTKLRTDWQSKPQKNVGTHCIRSITYGGQLVISISVIANRDEDKEKIKASATAHLAFSGSLEVNATGNFEKFTHDVSEMATLEIMAFATTGVFKPPTDIKTCMDLVAKYPEMVKEENDGKGAALRVDIVDLSTLHKDYSAYLQNQVLDAMMDDCINKWDDLKSTWEAYNDWEETNQWDDEWDKVVNEFSGRMKRAKDAFATAITNLDPKKGIEQFEAAYKLYGEGDLNIPNRYAREFKNLTYHIAKKPFNWYPYTTAVSSYVHWGSPNCSLPSPEPLFTGYAGTAPVGFGSGGNIECLPGSNPAFVQKKPAVFSEINGLLYELPDQKSGQVLCAFCKLENATVAYSISGRSDCPESMKLEYSGYLMTSRDAGTGSTFICMDKNPDDRISGDSQRFSDGSTASLSPVWTICEDCDEDENKKYVSCVVCSR